MRLAEIERIKLTANLLNSVAAGIVLTAVVAPVAGIAVGTMHVADLLNLAAFVLFGLVAAVVLHLIARRLLAALEDGR